MARALIEDVQQKFSIPCLPGTLTRIRACRGQIPTVFPGPRASVPVEKVLTRPPCTGQVDPADLPHLIEEKDSCKETSLCESAEGDTGVQRGLMTYPRPHRRHS